MRFYSTNQLAVPVSLKQAVLRSLAEDKGLFMPEKIPVIPKSQIVDFSSNTFQEIAFQVAKCFLSEDIPDSDLHSIIQKSITFDAPLVMLSDNIFALELFHGPTLAFKDFGARFMAGLMAHLVRGENRELTILVATSGDTGGAVAAGFHKAPGIKVVILYPSGKVSPLQEKQLTTFGDNITALEVKGTFDDCQKLVKEAFADSSLTERLNLSSANSINIARLLPQTFYYFKAWASLAAMVGKDQAEESVFSVPSGNFGNLTAGLIAKRMGLPIKHFIAATNINSTVPEYLETGIYSPRPSKPTISNAMDVGSPSNFARIAELYGNDLTSLKKDISGYSFTDEQTKEGLSVLFSKEAYISEPHGAVGYLGLMEYFKLMASHPPGVFVATAHPGKFKNIVEETIKKKVELPEALATCLGRKKQSIEIPNTYSALKEYLMFFR